MELVNKQEIIDRVAANQQREEEAEKFKAFKGYTVADVIFALMDQPDDAIVVMSCDEEGNMYSPMHSIANAAPFKKGPYVNSKLIDDGTKVVILYPSH